MLFLNRTAAEMQDSSAWRPLEISPDKSRQSKFTTFNHLSERTDKLWSIRHVPLEVQGRPRQVQGEEGVRRLFHVEACFNLLYNDDL